MVVTHFLVRIVAHVRAALEASYVVGYNYYHLVHTQIYILPLERRAVTNFDEVAYTYRKFRSTDLDFRGEGLELDLYLDIALLPKAQFHVANQYL